MVRKKFFTLYPFFITKRVVGRISNVYNTCPGTCPLRRTGRVVDGG
ncbi:MAG: hypothetical protein PHH79_06330 [Aminobacterium colombiense]|nr:hypothetical protein [Aminobacterium colombiense]